MGRNRRTAGIYEADCERRQNLSVQNVYDVEGQTVQRRV